MKKTLGIIGGMGPEASEVFYLKLTQATKAEKDQDHLNILLWSHADIPDRTASIEAGKTEELWAIMAKDVQMLKDCGCDYLAVPCNTSHVFQDRFNTMMGGHFISMIDEAAACAKTVGTTIGVLGTDGTRMNDLYGKALRRNGCTCVYPDKEDQEGVMHIIYDQIKKGQRGDLSLFLNICSHMKAKGCDAVILACTELSVLKNNYAELSDPWYLDAMDALVKTCVTTCGGIYQGNL
ncbi:MAG: amino acid racemase [Lactimicrobium sp.]|jgi:aspartate racemase|uniref:aspartate/glutamate racemase family protein n=1 Tax=Lactimicrobium sp. TaxID=2563780 RepID=UPI002F3569AD